MKPKDKISRIMERLQRSLLPILVEWSTAPLTDMEKWLAKAFEVVERRAFFQQLTMAAERKTIAP